MAAFRLHRPVEDEWELVREMRLRMVLDTPGAFLETAEQVLARDEQGWRERLRQQRAPGSDRIVAVDAAGRWIGSAGCFVSEGSPGYVAEPRPGPPRANLVGVFVDPAWRGAAGVLDALLDEVAHWARDQGLRQLHLHVGETNERAMRAYLSRGFRPTGVVDTIPENPGLREVELVLEL